MVDRRAEPSAWICSAARRQCNPSTALRRIRRSAFRWYSKNTPALLAGCGRKHTFSSFARCVIVSIAAFSPGKKCARKRFALDRSEPVYNRYVCARGIGRSASTQVFETFAFPADRWCADCHVAPRRSKPLYQSCRQPPLADYPQFREYIMLYCRSVVSL